jgi:hypothetical protein
VTDESALLVTVPAAEPAVARHRSRLDTSAAVGVPAHIAVLYPFLPPDLIDADTHATLARLFASVPGFRINHLDDEQGELSGHGRCRGP